MIESKIQTSDISTAELIANNDFVLWYSALLHVIFGSVMGLMSGFLLHDRYRNVKRIHSFW